MRQRSFVAWPALVAGVMATFVGIGLARFAYTPLIPQMVQSQWFNAADAVYLGAANLLGYLIGALAAYRFTRWFGMPVVVGASLIAVVFSFWACVTPQAFAWFFAWRLIAGLSGALLMVVVPSMVLAATPPERRVVLGTLVFSGVGLGALLAATVIPLVLVHGLTATWWLLGGLSLLGGGFCFAGVRRLMADVPLADRIETCVKSEPEGAARTPKQTPFISILVWPSVALVILAYALDGIGFVPHTVFWVDFLARENNLGQAAGAFQWALFGLGATVGPFLMGRLVRHVGWHRALWLAFISKASAVLLPLITLSWLGQVLSSLVVGALTPGIVALVSGRLAQLVRPEAHQRVWGMATGAFALAQAAGGFGMAVLFDVVGSAVPLFALGSLVLWAGCFLVWVSGRLKSDHLPSSS